MVVKNTKNLSNIEEKGIEINNSKIVYNDSINNMPANCDVMICKTEHGDLTIQSFSGGKAGQKIVLIKTDANNSIILYNENAYSDQQIKTSNKQNVYALKDKTGVIELFCDGTYWYYTDTENKFVLNAGKLASAQPVITLNNCLSANFNFCVQCATGVATININATKLNLTSATGKYTQISSVVAGTMNNKISYTVTFTNTTITLNIITSAVAATVTGEYKIYK